MMFLKNFIYKSFVLLFPVILLSGFKCDAQIISEQGLLNPSPGFNKKRFVAVILSESTLATIVTIGLQYLWYKKYPKTLFHFFNDNDEWLQMDKVGYATAAYNIAAVPYNLMRWSGVNKNRSLNVTTFF